MILCNYGCGQEAKYQIEKGKWCCSKFYWLCPSQRKKKLVQIREEPFFGENIKEAYETLKNMFKGGKNMKCNLIVGHRANHPGACNKTHNMCEYLFNNILACDIQDKLKGSDIYISIIYRRTYKTLPDDINKVNPDFFISLHCNAFNGKTNGTETLYYHTSKRSKKMAEILQKNMLKAYGFKNRGVLARTTEDRGGYLLRYTNMPGVIAEPFFIDNDDAYETVMTNYDKLVKAYVDSIEAIVKVI